MSNKQIYLKIRKHQPTVAVTAEKYFYELKPLIYFAICFNALTQYDQFDLWVKYSALGVLVFTIYITLSRLNHRGFWS